MFIKSRFRWWFDKQYGKRAQTLLKSAPHHLCHIHWSRARILCSKKSLLLTWKILGLLVNILATVENCPVLHRDNLTLQLQMQLYHIGKFSSQFFAAFLKSRSNFECFETKKMTLIAFVFPKLRTLNTWLDKCIKSLVSEDPSTNNMVNVPKRCWNQHHITFIISTDHCQDNWFVKSLCYWNAKSWDSLLTHWLPMKSILFLKETI